MVNNAMGSPLPQQLTPTKKDGDSLMDAAKLIKI
jgi:hypothetical protein